MRFILAFAILIIVSSCSDSQSEFLPVSQPDAIVEDRDLQIVASESAESIDSAPGGPNFLSPEDPQARIIDSGLSASRASPAQGSQGSLQPSGTGNKDDDDNTCPGVDQDGDGFGSGCDCDDSDPSIYPGTVCESDDNDCTNDVCDESFTGECLHLVTQEGSPCNLDEGECANQDTCDGAGICVDNGFKMSGVNCGDSGDDCTNQDMCDGSGTCVDNGFAVGGAPCGDQGDFECSEPDTCDGQGSCLENHVSMGENCGDSGDECTNQDMCDGLGNCGDEGFQSPNTPCGDTGDECTNQDLCDGSGACVDNGFQMAGAVCGDAGDLCINQDTCDGSGICIDNGFKIEGTTCGNPGNGCTIADTCDAMGTCIIGGQNPPGTPCGGVAQDCQIQDECDDMGNCIGMGFEQEGTSCGDTGESDCSFPDACDDSGNCLDNHRNAGEFCGQIVDTNIGCELQDICDGMGGCSDSGFKNQNDPCGGIPAECESQDTCDDMGNCTDQGFANPDTLCDVSAGGCENIDDNTCDMNGMCQINNACTFNPSNEPLEARLICASPQDTDPDCICLEDTTLNINPLEQDLNFGAAMDISGSVAIVGAPGGGGTSGEIHILRQNSGVWALETEIIPGDLVGNEGIGNSVGADGSKVIFASPTPDDFQVGAAYIYRDNGGGNWVFEQKLEPTGALDNDSNFYAREEQVDIKGDLAILGAPNLGGNIQGQAFVFRFNGTSWVQEIELSTLITTQTQGLFGESVDIDDSGERIAVSEPVGGNGASLRERVRIFFYDSVMGWVLEDTIALAVPSFLNSDGFGASVSIDGDRIAVSSPSRFSGAGRIYIFERDTMSSLWSQTAEIIPSRTSFSSFGNGLVLEGDNLLQGSTNGTITLPSLGGKMSGYASLWQESGGWSETRVFYPCPGLFPFTEYNFIKTFGKAVALEGERVIIGEPESPNSGSPNMYGTLYFYELAP